MYTYLKDIYKICDCYNLNRFYLTERNLIETEII